MTIKEFNLLEIDVYDKDEKELLYSGMCEEAPEDLKNKDIKILRMSQKKLIIKLV